MPVKNYYEILGVAPTATLEEIHAAYTALADEYIQMADANPQTAAKRSVEISKIYGILSNPKDRKVYDRSHGLNMALPEKTLYRKEQKPLPPDSHQGMQHITRQQALGRFNSHCLSFKGRSTRKKYWLIGIPVIIPAYLIALFLSFLLSQVITNEFFSFLHWIPFILYIPVAYISLAFLVRRFHDAGFSGRWLFLPIVLGLFPFDFSAILSLFSFFFILYLTVKPSVSDNKYGSQWEETKK